MTEMKTSTDSYYQIDYKIVQENSDKELTVFTFLTGTEDTITVKAQEHIKQLNAGAKKGWSFELVNISLYKKD